MLGIRVLCELFIVREAFRNDTRAMGCAFHGAQRGVPGSWG